MHPDPTQNRKHTPFFFQNVGLELEHKLRKEKSPKIEGLFGWAANPQLGSRKSTSRRLVAYKQPKAGPS